MKKIALTPVGMPQEQEPLVYCGERLTDVIVRAMEQGVPPDLGVNPLMFDEDESFDVDPNSDIRTDLFELSERAEAGFTASQLQKLKDSQISAEQTVEDAPAEAGANAGTEVPASE